MCIIEITDLETEALKPYLSLTDKQLRTYCDGGLFIAESPKVINSALQAGMVPVSLLCEKKHIEGDAAEIIRSNPEMPVYTGTRELLAQLTGYTLTRGVLCAMKRPELPPTCEILKHAKRICVIYDVCDTTNIGNIFRSAAALGIDGIILSPETCDPLNRRSIRVSMGTVFQIPWCYDSNIIKTLRDNDFISISMALEERSIFLQDFEIERDKKYAVIFGSEGYGLPENVIKSTDVVVKIPMHNNVDSLNVGAAAAITMWHIAEKI